MGEEVVPIVGAFSEEFVGGVWVRWLPFDSSDDPEDDEAEDEGADDGGHDGDARHGAP